MEQNEQEAVQGRQENLNIEQNKQETFNFDQFEQQNFNFDQYQNEVLKNKKRKFPIILKIIAIFLIIAVSFTLGNVSMRYGLVIGPDSSKYKDAIVNIDELSKFNTLFEVKAYINQIYDGEIDDEKLTEGATKGMANALGDPYTVYMGQEEFKKYMDSNSGEFMGIGVYITATEKSVVVSGLIDGGNAKKVGILPGDTIMQVDGEDIGNDVSKAVSIISGPEDKTMTIKVGRENTDPFDVQVSRSKVETVSAKGEMVTGNVGYLILQNFDKHSSTKFKQSLSELKNNGMKGLIIDLRGNGGGYLDEAVSIASEFIPKNKTVTYTLDKYDKKKIWASNGEKEIDNYPVVVLIDENSASASEVLTGALRDYGIATTVGVTSFGKGIVQSIFPLPNDNGGLKITTSKYYTPNGENIHKKGIEPDFRVELPSDVMSKKYSRDLDTQYQKALEVIEGKLQ